MFKVFKRKRCRHKYELADLHTYAGSGREMVEVFNLICKHCDKVRSVKRYEYNKLKESNLIEEEKK